MTPLQAGALLFLHRHAVATLTDAAVALGVRLPTMSTVVTALVRKRWVTKCRSAQDDRVVHVRLSQRGRALTRHIEQRVAHVKTTLTEQDRRAFGLNLKARRAYTLAP